MWRDQRLTRAEFASAFEKGTAISGPLLVVRVRPTGGAHTRWGFAVGKKLVRHAVGRNALRRKLREACRSLEVAPGYDVVVVARRGAPEATYDELRRALGSRLRRAGLVASR